MAIYTPPAPWAGPYPQEVTDNFGNTWEALGPNQLKKKSATLPEPVKETFAAGDTLPPGVGPIEVYVLNDDGTQTLVTVAQGGPLPDGMQGWIQVDETDGTFGYHYDEEQICCTLTPGLKEKLKSGPQSVAFVGDSYTTRPEVLVDPISAALGVTGVAYDTNGGNAGQIRDNTDYAGITQQAPCAIFVTAGANDYYDGIVPAAYESALKTLLSSLQNAEPNAEVVFIIQPEIVVNAPGAAIAPWSDYVAAAIRCAEASGVPYMNMSAVIPMSDSGAAADSLWSDDAHPNAAGGEAFAELAKQLTVGCCPKYVQSVGGPFMDNTDPQNPRLSMLDHADNPIGPNGRFLTRDSAFTDWPTHPGGVGTVDDCGTHIFCDSGGRLRGVPEHTSFVERIAPLGTEVTFCGPSWDGSTGDSSMPGGGSQPVLSYHEARAVITNPSLCRSMCIEKNMGQRLDLQQAVPRRVADGDFATIALYEWCRVNGGPWSLINGHAIYSGVGRESAVSTLANEPIPFTLPPGGTAVIDTVLTMQINAVARDVCEWTILYYNPASLQFHGVTK